MRKRTPESGVLKACLDLLGVHHIWHRRWNTGAVKDGNRFFRFGRKGDADIICTPLRYVEGKELIPMLLWIECKSDKGRQTEDQKQFMYEVWSHQHNYLVVRDVNELSAWLKEHGCI